METEPWFLNTFLVVICLSLALTNSYLKCEGWGPGVSCQTSLEFSGSSCAVFGSPRAFEHWGVLGTLLRFSLAVAQLYADPFLTHLDVGVHVRASWDGPQEGAEEPNIGQSWDPPGIALCCSW